MAKRSGGKILVDALKIHGVDVAFEVPGESYIAILDALYDAPEIRLITCRQEGGAAYMADAYGKLTGRPGICFVTRGPGATNASVGIHTARHDSTPMILFIGQVARESLERDAFQEVDYRQFFGRLAKWVGQIDDPRRIPEYVSHAFHRATSGRPGPVVLALPEDMLAEEVDVADTERYREIASHPGAEELRHVGELLAGAQRPVMIVGGGGWTPQGFADLHAFAEAHEIPVAASFRRQDRFDNTHRLYAGYIGAGGSPKLARRIKEADLILALGCRLSEMPTSGYTLLDVPQPKQSLIHVYPGPDEIGRVYHVDIPINAGSNAFAAAMRAIAPVNPSARAPWARQLRQEHEADRQLEPMPGNVDLATVFRGLSERLPANAIMATGAGNFATWFQRYHQFRSLGTLLGPTSGSMGSGLPAAIAAKILHPDRIVVAIVGDGDFLMTGQELATAVQYDLPVVTILVNNGMYGTIRMHQERDYPGRVSGTDLRNPDFAAYARAFGAFGERVERTADFPAAFERALAAGRPALLELPTDPRKISARASVNGGFAQPALNVTS